MINFWRVVRMALRYRIRYGLAVFFALAGALFFGGNIAAALPLLKVLFNKQTLQEYVDSRIADNRESIAEIQRKLESVQDAGVDEPFDNSRQIDSPETEHADSKALRYRMSKASRSLRYYQIAKPWVDRFVPTDR